MKVIPRTFLWLGGLRASALPRPSLALRALCALRAPAGCHADGRSRRHGCPSFALRALLAVRALIPISAILAGCQRDPTVTIYTSVDQEFAQAILQRFEQQTGLHVAAVYDSEAGKTTGFLRRLEREKDAPRCDVWWSSEVFGTIELARQNLLVPYDSPAAADIPPAWKDPQHRWIGLAARARVVVFNTQRLKRGDLPASLRELGEPAWARRLALANPQFGTTRGQIAFLFEKWGEPAGKQFLQALRDAGAQITDGNSQVVRLVASGAADIGLTDSDDVWVAQRRGEPVELAYLGHERGAPPLWIPCTVALVRGAPHAEAARRLADYLVSAQVEAALLESDSRNVPVRAALRAGKDLPEPVPVDFNAADDALPPAMRAVQDILLR